MLSFILRRVFVSALLLLGAAFIMYQLTAASGDPLQHLREGNDPNKEQLMRLLSERLDLDVPAPLRFFLWLGGAAQCLVPFAGTCDLGVNILNQPVTALLPIALTSTVQLLSASTVLAIVFGVIIGIVSALRQNSGFDFSVTFLVFLMFSLPSFFIAVLLKEFIAIGFNDFLSAPEISPLLIVGIAVVAGIIWQSMVGGVARRRATIFAISALATGGVVAYMSVTDWFRFPGLGPVVVSLVSIGIAVLLATLLSGLASRRGLVTGLVVAALGIVTYFLVQPLFNISTIWTVIIVGAIFTTVGVAVGFFAGGYDRGVHMRIGGFTAFLTFLVIVLDRSMQAWNSYFTNSAINGRPIATVGSSTPTLRGDMWVLGLDTFTHFLLPTLALVLISLASYTRYVRAGMLEVLNQDYIRTARAKGLSERSVVMRHAFRNSLIPLATFIPVDIASIVGGAIITEQVFSISGMGQLFIRSLQNVDPNPVMAYFVIVSIVVLIANLVADLSYAVLDPRVRAPQ
ncbi:MAG: ABC transporter permease subunit [Burkholderiaceae bacterium]|nr:ABC transporter permease subunit [Microbacteriaceae bacterium]